MILYTDWLCVMTCTKVPANEVSSSEMVEKPCGMGKLVVVLEERICWKKAFRRFAGGWCGGGGVCWCGGDCWCGGGCWCGGDCKCGGVVVVIVGVVVVRMEEGQNQ